MTIIAVDRLNSGADVYKLAALGTDLVKPLEVFEFSSQCFPQDYPGRRRHYENIITSLTKEFMLVMGAGGITNYYHMVGNRDLLRSLDGRITKRPGGPLIS